MTTTGQQQLAGQLRGHDVPLGLYINGTWIESGHAFGVRDPNTGTTIADR